MDQPPLPANPLALAAVLPDLPRWVETRWMLQSGSGRLTVDPDHRAGALVLCEELRLGAVVGHPGVDFVREILQGRSEGINLIVQLEALEGVREAIPEWAIAVAAIHARPAPIAPSGHEPSDDVVLAPPGGALTDELPEDLRPELPHSSAMAIRRVEGRVASVCCATAVTETLWDVGVETVEGHRRRGHASACFDALAEHLAATGRRPVWGAEEGNAASLGLAEKLGFQSVDRLAVARPG